MPSEKVFGVGLEVPNTLRRYWKCRVCDMRKNIVLGP